MKKLGWFWCLHCSRAIASKAGHRPKSCPFDNCDGGPLDMMEWDSVRENNPANPATPVHGNRYPLYRGEANQQKSDRSDFAGIPYTEMEAGEDEFWCATIQGAAKLLGVTAGKIRIYTTARRLSSFVFNGKRLVPLADLAQLAGKREEELLKDAQDLSVNLTMIGVF